MCIALRTSVDRALDKFFLFALSALTAKLTFPINFFQLYFFLSIKQLRVVVVYCEKLQIISQSLLTAHWEIYLLERYLSFTVSITNCFGKKNPELLHFII